MSEQVQHDQQAALSNANRACRSATIHAIDCVRYIYGYQIILLKVPDTPISRGKPLKEKGASGAQIHT